MPSLKNQIRQEITCHDANAVNDGIGNDDLYGGMRLRLRVSRTDEMNVHCTATINKTELISTRYYMYLYSKKADASKTCRSKIDNAQGSIM